MNLMRKKGLPEIETKPKAPPMRSFHDIMEPTMKKLAEEARADPEFCTLTRSKRHEYTIPLDYVGVDTMMKKVLGPSRTPTAFLCIALGCVCGAEKERKMARKTI